MPFEEDVNGPRPAINKLNDFITCRYDRTLRPLHLADSSLSKFSAELDSYVSVLERGGSVAFSRGEDLASVHLSKSIETVFKTPTPSVKEGPPLTWSMIILFAGPHFVGPSTLKIGESLVELTEDDLKMLSSGRPWRFLNPWPDKNDCEKELRSSEMVRQEIYDTRQILQEVLEKMAVIEQRLANHSDAVTRLFQDQHRAIIQERVLGGATTQGNLPDESAPGGGALNRQTWSESDRPPARPDMHYPTCGQGSCSHLKDLHDDGVADGSAARNNMQYEGLRVTSAAGQAPQLHSSDFIQTLSE